MFPYQKNLTLMIIAIQLCTVILMADGATRVDVTSRMKQGLDNHLRSRHRRDLTRSILPPEQLLGLTDGINLESTETIVTAQGKKKEKFVEKYQGLPVSGQSVVFEMDNTGRYTGDVSGTLVDDINKDLTSLTPTITTEEALMKATLVNMDSVSSVTFDPETDMSLEIQVSGGGAVYHVHPVLVYKLSYLVVRPRRLARPFTVLNAHTGEVLATWEGLATSSGHRSRRGSALKDRPRIGANLPRWRLMAFVKKQLIRQARQNGELKLARVMGEGGNLNTGRVVYGRDLPALRMYRLGNTCFMENEHVRVINMNAGFHVDNPLDENRPLDNNTHKFNCELGNHDYINGAFSPLNDAFYFSNVVYDMFNVWYDVIPLKFKVVSRVHFGVSFENAFWDGRHTNFGDGNDLFFPLTTLDMMAHEITHGFTEQHSGLIYTGHSGAVNEAFADIAAAAAEDFALGTDWRQGYDALKLAKTEAMRYLDDPPRDGHSIAHYKDYCPGMDVHFASGIFNRAFYILAVEFGWGVRTAFEVFLTANRLYWKPDTSFQEAACDIVRAAEDTGKTAGEVIKAFRKVGIEPCVTSRKGLDRLFDLSASKNEAVSFEFHLHAGHSMVRFETVQYFRSKGQSDLKVTYPGGETSSRHVGSSEVVFIEAPPAGNYQIQVEAVEDFGKVDLYAVTSETLLYKNLSLGEDDTVSVSVTLPPEATGNLAEYVALRVTGKWGYPPHLYLRYGMPVDLEQLKMDMVGHTVETMNGDVSQVLLCRPHPGVYHLLMSGFPGWDEIDVYYLTLAQPVM